jgi:hypothetical protein
MSSKPDKRHGLFVKKVCHSRTFAFPALAGNANVSEIPCSVKPQRNHMGFRTKSHFFKGKKAIFPE